MATRFRRVMFLAAAGPAAVLAQPSYTRDVAPILRAKCAQCHRAGDIAPFPLTSFEAAFDYKDDVRNAVSEGRMPPWKPVAGYGSFRDSTALTTEEKTTLLEWIDAGAPRGDDADLPEVPAETGEWVLGEPDQVLQMAEPYTAPRGRDMYRCFVLPAGGDQDRWVSAVDFLPGDRRSVHHIILYLDPKGESERLDARDEGPGYTCFGGPGTTAGVESLADVTALLSNGISLGGWAPGTRPHHLPDGTAMKLPRGARIIMQVHYYVRGGAEPDQTRIGIYYARSRVTRQLLQVPILPLDRRGRPSLEIPAGAEKHEVRTEFVVPPPISTTIVTIFPHMHLLGTEIKADIVRLNGTVEPLIYIDKWDFNWQGAYTYTEPVPLSMLQRVRLSCTYNNSESNPRNPNNPLKTIRWGEGTEDEMCLVFLGLTF